MTSDGISAEDWDQVHELVVQVVNATEENEEQHRTQLSAYLRDLTAKYGERPSILATQADYAEDPRESERLFLRAFDLALTSHDTPNIREVALSLANLYARELPDPATASRWLDIAGAQLEPDNAAEWREYRQIEASIARLKKGSSNMQLPADE